MPPTGAGLVASGGNHIAVEARRYRDSSLQRATVDATGEMGW